jgi:MFS family permease
MSTNNSARSLTTFYTLWFGQLISLLGSELTGFSLGVWVYQQTGSATQFALIALCTVLPGVLLSSIAGVVADRWDRRWLMIASDVGAGISTLIIAILLFSGQLASWHIWGLTAVNSIFSAFQWPAYMASLTRLVPQKKLGHANGLVQLGQAVGQLFAPMLAGILVVSIQLQGILFIDFVTFLFAVTTLFFIRIPGLPTTAVLTPKKESFWQQITSGWRYLAGSPGLVGLLILTTTNYFLMGFVEVLGPLFILSFASTAAMGTVFSIGATGMLVGSLAMSTWSGPKRRIYGVMVFEALGGLCILTAGLRPSVTLFGFLAFVFLFGCAICSGYARIIIQSQVPQNLHGRVFGIKRTVTWVARPIAFLIAGPLADKVMEPLLAVNGAWASTIGQIVGVGPGRGIGFLLVMMGGLTVIITTLGYLYAPLRHVEGQKISRNSYETAVITPSS